MTPSLAVELGRRRRRSAPFLIAGRGCRGRYVNGVTKVEQDMWNSRTQGRR